MCEVWRMTRRRRRPADTPSMRRLVCSSFRSARLRLWLAEKKLEVLGSDVEAWCAVGLDRTPKNLDVSGLRGRGSIGCRAGYDIASSTLGFLKSTFRLELVFPSS